jgi:hypothetical protein
MAEQGARGTVVSVRSGLSSTATLPRMNQTAAVETWRRLLDPAKSWVLFSHGTCLILMGQLTISLSG